MVHQIEHALGTDTNGAVTTAEVGEWYQVASDCTLSFSGCAVTDSGVGVEQYYALSATFDIGPQRWSFAPNCDPVSPQLLTRVSTAPLTTSGLPAIPTSACCSQANSVDVVDITFVNNTSDRLALWYHDETCTARFRTFLAPASQVVESTFVNHYFSFNRQIAVEISNYAATRPGQHTWCAEQGAPC